MGAVVVFVICYVAFAVGRIPGLRSDRVAAAVVGAALMIALGVLSFADAERTVDGATLALLFGMMILSASLETSGAFAMIGDWVVRRTRRPIALLAAVSLATAVLSALMINDVICLAFTPLVLDVCEALECDPRPYLIALATSANIGSAATITGNPQNILIASLSHVSYLRFAEVLAPVSVVCLVINVAVIAFVYRDAMRKPFALASGPPHSRFPRSARKAIFVGAAVLVAFVAGASPALAAIMGGSAMLLTRRTLPREIYNRIDWTLLALFGGLFVITGGIERVGAGERIVGWLSALGTDTVGGLAVLTAILSSAVSNVPAVMVLRSVVRHAPHAERAWLTLAMASTLGGNLSLPGSIATIIVVERAKNRASIGFFDFAKCGTPVAIVSIVIGAAWISLVVR